MRVRPFAVLLSLAVAFSLAVRAEAQSPTVDRYELGLRLRAFERALDATPEPQLRKAAFAELDRAVQAFFGLDFAGVATAVARAHAALAGKPATAASAFEERAWLFAERRLLDPAAGPAKLELRELPLPRSRDDDDGPTAESLDPVPADLELVVLAQGGARELVRTRVADRPQSLDLPVQDLPEGDHALPWRLVRGDRVLAARELHLSLAKDCDRRLAALDRETERDDLEARTGTFLARQLTSMTRARREETVLPGERLLRDAEALTTLAADATYYDDARTGQHWLVVPTEKGAVTVRLCVPAAKRDGDRPLVFALHGAGGSENLFCDGYGDGAIVRLCEQRNWLLCAPRSAGMTGVDVPALLDALDARYAIDRRRVFLVGHSMGAMQGLAQVTRSPKTFAGAALLSGGGGVRRTADLARLPFFVAAGSRDFGRGGSKGLHDALRRLEVRSDYREYEDVEHLAVVQVALPDVFAFFDACAKGAADAR